MQKNITKELLGHSLLRTHKSQYFMLSDSNKTPVFRAGIWSGFFTALPSLQVAARQAYSFLQLQLAPRKLNNPAAPEKKNQAESKQESEYRGKSWRETDNEKAAE